MIPGNLLRTPRSCQKPALILNKPSNTASVPAKISHANGPAKPSQKSRSRRRRKQETRKSSRSLLTGSDTGFAQFLRDHSSSAHQRVTAGGRIVPMLNQQLEQDVDHLRENRSSDTLFNSSDYDDHQHHSLPGLGGTLRNPAQGSSTERDFLSHVAQPFNQFAVSLPWSNSDPTQLVQGVMTDPGEPIPVTCLLPSTPDCQTPLNILNLHIMYAVCGYPFRPQAFEMSMHWLVFHNSWNIQDMIGLRYTLGNYWKCVNDTLSLVNQSIAQTDITPPDLSYFRALYLRMRWNVYTWQHTVGDTIRAGQPSYRDQFDTDESEWGEEDTTRACGDGTRNEDRAEYHHNITQNGRDSSADVQYLGECQRATKAKIAVVIRTDTRVASDPSNQAQSSGRVGKDSRQRAIFSSHLRGHSEPDFCPSSSYSEVRAIGGNPSKVTPNDGSDVSIPSIIEATAVNIETANGTNADAIAPPEKCKSITTVRGAKNGLVVSHGLDCEQHESVGLMRAFAKCMKPQATRQNGNFHGVVLPPSWNEVDVLYHSGSTTSYTGYSTQKPPEPTPEAIRSDTDKSVQNYSRIYNSLIAVIGHLTPRKNQAPRLQEADANAAVAKKSSLGSGNANTSIFCRGKHKQVAKT